MRYESIDPNLFVRNRARLAARLKPRSVAVLNANDVMPTSADGVRSFIQNTDLFYLTGIDQEETILLLCPDAPDPKDREILFIRKTDERIAVWEGPRHTIEEARAISGIGSVRWTSAFEGAFRALAVRSDRIYLNTNEHLRADTSVESRDDRFRKWCLDRYPLHRYERLAPLMALLRAVKSAEEVALIRRACAITDSAFRRVLGAIRPGVWEYEIEAEIRHEFIRNGARGPAYDPIIASGPNSRVLHYVKNDRRCEAGDLVLMDFGAAYANYAADMTRTVPVSGRFTPRQRAVYDAVLRVQRAAIEMLRPGAILDDYQKAVGRLVEAELIGLGLLDAAAVRDQDPDKPLYKTFFMHGTSHHLGLDVHDLGDRYRPLAPGMVLTCEPGIYIEEEGFGVRLENDILVTEDAPVDLMAEIPIEADEIEALMAAGR